MLYFVRILFHLLCIVLAKDQSVCHSDIWNHVFLPVYVSKERIGFENHKLIVTSCENSDPQDYSFKTIR